MIFPYVEYGVESTSAIPAGVICRPEIRFRLIGPKRSVQLSGLIDTGADHIFVSASLAEVIGIKLSKGAEQAVGAGGHELDVWPNLVNIELTRDGETYRWKTVVGFITGDDELPLAYLGHAGFLEYFRATFDGEAQTVELVPNQQLPRILGS